MVGAPPISRRASESTDGERAIEVDQFTRTLDPHSRHDRSARAPSSVTALTAAALLAASLVLAGLRRRRRSPRPDGSGPEAQESRRVRELEPTWPLTGLPVTGDDEAAQDHPVMVAQDRQHRRQRTAAGARLGRPGRRGARRGRHDPARGVLLLRDPRRVGPVRSMRASDIGIVSPVDGAIVTSGAAAVTINRINDAGIQFFSEGAHGLLPRRATGSAPYNLFADLSEVADGRPGRRGARPTTTCRGATTRTSRRASRPRTLAA